jgi:branched-chain amino acid transport system substrate-binding protein
VLVAIFGLTTCTFINGRGFDECASDQECGSSRLCVERYCLPLPSQCRREVGGFDDPSVIRFAALVPASAGFDGGAPNQSVLATINAMSLAILDINGRNGLANRPFGLIVCNTGNSDPVLNLQLDWVIQQAKVPAVIIPNSGPMQKAADNAARINAGTVIISQSATSPELDNKFAEYGSVWRVAPSDAQQSVVMARWLTTEPSLAGIRDIAIAYQDDSYGDPISSRLRSSLADAGRRVEAVSYIRPTPAVAPMGLTERLLAFHQASQPSRRLTVFVGFPKELVPTIAEGKTRLSSIDQRPVLSADAGHVWFFADAAKNPSIITPETRDEIERAFGTAPSQGAGGPYISFRQRLRDRFGTDADAFSYTSHSYDATFVIALAAAYASRDNGEINGPRLNEGIRQLSTRGGMVFPLEPMSWGAASSQLRNGMPINVEGASGPLDFNLDSGVPTSPYEIWRVVNGSITREQLVSP